MRALDSAMAAARREDELRADLEAYLRNVACQRVERDDGYEQQLRDEIAEAERAWRGILEARRRAQAGDAA